MTTTQAIALTVGIGAMALLAIAAGIRTLLEAANAITDDQDERNRERRNHDRYER